VASNLLFCKIVIVLRVYPPINVRDVYKGEDAASYSLIAMIGLDLSARVISRFAQLVVRPSTSKNIALIVGAESLTLTQIHRDTRVPKSLKEIIFNLIRKRVLLQSHAVTWLLHTIYETVMS